MAATQAEPQQNEVNRDLVQQEQPPALGNPGLQNGTDKSANRSLGGSDLAGSKGKISSQISLPVEMSQYRQESGAGPPLHNSDQNANSSDEVAGKINNSDNKSYSHNSEQGGGGDQNYGKGPSDNSNQNIQGYGIPFAQRQGYHHSDPNSPMQIPSENSLHHQSNSYGQYNPQNMRHGYPGSKPMPGPPRPPSGGSVMNSGANFPHGPPQRFMTGQSISQPTGPTPTLNQLLQASNPVHRYQNSYADYNMPKSGEQPQGNMPYNQSWPPPRSMPPYGPQQGSPGFRNPPSSVQQVQGSRGGYGGAPSGGSGGGGGGGGGASPGYPPPASPGGGGSGGGGGPGPQHHYPPYPQRYPTPPSAGSGPQPPPPQQTGPPHPPSQQQQQQPSPQPPMPQSPSQQRQQQQQPPYSPHQMVGSPYGGPPPNAGGSSSGGGPHQSPQHQQPGGPPPPGPTNGPGPGPPPPPGPYGGERWPPPTPSAGPPPSPTQPQPQPSPQPQPPPPSPQQHQSFPSRPQQASTPNAHAPDPGDLHGGNSNDSCSGGVGAAPGTPNSQGGMRPTPSPTGSTGSRSMSPAVGQQNIPMPPRPPSSQSDGGGPARISHSPIAASQGVYQQQLAPPGGHMHNYKMGNVGPVGPGGPGGPGGPMVPQQMPPGSPYSAAAQQQYPPQQGGGQYPGSPRPPPHNQMQYGGPPPPNQSYGAQGGPPGPNNMPGGPGSQYPPSRAILNHVSHSPHSPHSQFGGYQGWGSPGPMNQGPPPGPPMMGPCPGGGNNHVAAGGGGKAGPGPQPTGPSGPSGPPPGPQTPPQPSNASPRSHTPPHYLKQHLQHKVGLSGAGMPPSPGGGYPTNSGPMPPHHHQGGPMGPPPQHPHSHHPGMGPPPPSSMGPPPPNSHHDGPMPPPASTPNSHSTGGPPPPHADMADMHDNGITTTASGTVMTSVSGSQTTGGVTSVVTTGPDGTPMDEASQQSTLSNASAASGGEDATCTPGKSRGSAKDAMLYHPHAPTPHSSAPSPSQPPNTPSSINSLHDDYPPDNSPTWSRTPSSPVFNSHVPQDLYRPKKHDSLGKLYEMDETVERKVWLDKLLQFMEERGTPISACPTISKNPLDLFRLYLYVKERGGFMEVCKVAKNKIWKDIAGLLGIGASSSAAYTLRKHYTKNLLPFECHFDRGGIDPQPIINQVESSTKKKGSKANPVPSPGTSSSNSQDSFPAPGGGPGSGSMDGYNYGYPQDYNNQRPPSQSNQGSGAVGHGAPDISVSNPFEDILSNANSSLPLRGGVVPRHPHVPPGMLGGYQNQGGYSQYPDQYNQQYPGAPAPGGGSYPPNRPMYPPAPYGAPEAERGYSQGGGSGQGQGQGGQPGSQDPYRGYMGPGNQPGYPPRPGYPPQGPPQGGPPGQSGAGASPGSQGNAPSSQADYYNRGDQVYQGQGGAAGGPPGPGGYPVGTPPSKCMPPPTNQPRRHPDFASKADQQPTGPYPPYNQQRPNMYSGQGGWSSTNNSQYRGPGGQFASQPPSAGGGVGGGWSGGPPRPGPAGPPPPTGQQPPPPPGSQWADQHRYPPNSQPPFQSPQQWASVNNMSNSIGPNASMRPQLGPRSNFRPDGKQFGQMSSGGPGMKGQGVGVQTGAKREMVFPAESVEATTPVLYKRRRLTKSDVAPVDAWRLMMALRSGLLAETCWALDVLNILLFDDNAVAYFGLGHLPGLLDILLEHFRRALADMLESNTTFNDEQPITQPITNEKHYQWYERCVQSSADVDLGQVEKPPDPCERTPLVKCGEHTLRTHRGVPVTVVPASDDIFVLDSKRAWDMDSEFIMPEDGGCDLHDSLSYIVPCFRSDFGLVRFVRVLKTTNNNKNKDKVKDKDKDTVDPLASSAGNSNSCDSRTNNKSNKCDELQNECTLVKVKKEKEDEEPEVEKKVVADSSEMEVDDSSKCENNIKKELKDESETTTEKDPTLSRRIRDPSGTLKQRKVSDYEDECYSRDEASLSTVTESQDAIARRCICLSNILRNLTFVPGNELEFAKNSTFLGLLGKLLLLHHEHPLRTLKQRNYDREEDADFGDCCSSLNGDAEWWWEWLQVLRENALVCVANIAGHIDLEPITEEVSRPLLDGLLHWAVCPAAQGQDPFPSVGPSSPLSPQRLALEALVKLCVTDSNVDLVIATPPFSRLERLCAVLTRLLCRIEEQVLREFAVNLLHYLAAADSGMARTIALQSPCVSLLVAFIEQAEASALGVANQHGINALRDNPDCMGTSLDMLRRAARTLLHLAKHPDNRPLFLQQEQRLLALVMSQILDQQVAALISRVLFHCSRPPATTSSTTTTTTNNSSSS